MVSRRVTTLAFLGFAATLLLPATVFSGEPNTLAVAEWDHERYAVTHAPFSVTARLAAEDDARNLSVKYVIGDGAPQDADVAAMTDAAHTYSFEIDGLKDAAQQDLVFWLESGAANTDAALVSEQRRVPIVIEHDFDITANPPEEMHLAVSGDDAIAHYVPCCNIFAARLLATRVPINPTDVTKGLPAKLLSPFILLEPDQMVITTNGLNLKFTYTEEELAGRNPDDLVVYEFLHDHWRPAQNIEVRPDEKEVEIPCAAGGTFVLGLREQA